MPGVGTLPTTDRLRQLVAAMAGQPVLMLVDLVADRFIHGLPKRVSREAPVVILSWQGEDLIPGGGANAVANVAALGGRPLVLGVVGDDESGRSLTAAMRALGVATEGIIERAGYRTPTKTRILGGDRHGIKQQIVRYDIEEQRQLSAAEAERFAAVLGGWGQQARVAILSDYGYGAVLPELVPRVRRALAADSTILCDSRYRLADFSGVDGATPNEEEAAALFAAAASEEPADRDRAGGRIRTHLGTRFLLVTRGSRGMSLYEEKGAWQVPPHGSDQVADVTGAGDTVIGAFSLALAAGANPIEAALVADYAGGVVVSKLGTATLTAAELEEAVAADPRPLEELQWAGS